MGMGEDDSENLESNNCRVWSGRKRKCMWTKLALFTQLLALIAEKIPHHSNHLNLQVNLIVSQRSFSLQWAAVNGERNKWSKW